MKRLLIPFLILLISLISRIDLFLKDFSLWWDEAVYLAMADAFMGKFYYFESFRPLLFPWMLSLIGRVFGTGIEVGKMASLIFSLASPILIYLLARKVIEEEAAIYSALFLAINYYSIFYSTKALTESLAVLLISISILTFYLGVKQGKTRYFLISSLFVVLSSLTRHTSWYLVVALPLFLLLEDRKLAIRGGIIFFSSFWILISPLLLSNFLQFGNPFWPQIATAGMSTQEPPYFYLFNLPEFLGMAGMLVFLSLFLSKDGFVRFNLFLTLSAILLLSLVMHKETRFLMIALPSIVLLEGVTLKSFVKKRKEVLILAFFIASLFIFSNSRLFEVRKEEVLLPRTAKFIRESLPDETMLTTMTPHFSYYLKREFKQVPWSMDEVSCDWLRGVEENYVIYCSRGWYEPLEKAFLEKTKECISFIENITFYQRCLILKIEK
jgi:4-amino-4-deoxy-L-arabinose transferase-like glycosyltransferase